MEPSDSRLNSYYHHQHLQQQHHRQQQLYNHNHNPTTTTTVPTTVTTSASPTNGLMSPTEAPPFAYPQSAQPSAVASPPESVRRKRGRPRKYETPEQALAARKTASSSGASVSTSKKKEKELSLSACSSKKSQISAFGNVGQGLTPHIITVAAGEDVAQKIMMFTQQSMREICILSASGSISNASLRQPATSGGITYEGRFEIVSLSGSYVRTELGGRTGGLSICLSSTDGQIVGGGVGGPLQAAGPVQVIIGTFVMSNKKGVNTGVASEPYAPQLPSPAGEPSIGFRSGHDDSPRQTDWAGAPNARSSVSYDFKGRSHGGHQSPENGDY